MKWRGIDANFTHSDKSFLSLEEAQAFVAGKLVKTKSDSDPPKFYAVARGSYTGIFTDWDAASSAIKGWKGPKYKKFPTREEAVEFIKEWGDAKAIEGIGEKVPGAGADDDLAVDDNDFACMLMSDDDSPAITSMGMKSKRPVLEIHTDGSALKNGRAGAAAGVGVFFGVNDSR